MDDLETLDRLREAVAAQESAEPGGKSPLRDDLIFLEHRARWFAKQRDALLAMASDHTKAKQLFSDTVRYSDPSQRLWVFRGVLIRDGLINEADALEVAVTYTNADVIKRAKKQASERQELTEAHGSILSAASDKTEAARLYNILRGPLDRGKLDSWRRVLVDEGLLNPGWMPGTQ